MLSERAAIADLLERVCASTSNVFPGCATSDDGEQFQSETDIADEYLDVRRADFVAGRAAARAALKSAGRGAVAVLSDQHGVPLFPAGFVGSISHKHGYGVAIVGTQRRWRGIGVDLEYDAPDDDEDDLLDRVAVSSERSVVDALRAAGVASPATWILSTKEAVYKAVFPMNRVEFDYEDLVVNLDASGPGRFRVEALQDVPRADIVGIFGLSRGWLVSVALVEKAFDNRTSRAYGV
jgi:4'-phosphopantetheinyl transferase EntD